jgi:hypothetical protein
VRGRVVEGWWKVGGGVEGSRDVDKGLNGVVDVPVYCAACCLARSG